ncbi:hypothetical protein Tco_1498793 [Tanacetum coccineum]
MVLNSITIVFSRMSVNLARYQNRKQHAHPNKQYTANDLPKSTSNSNFHMKSNPNRKSYASALTKNANATIPPTPITIYPCPDLTTMLSIYLISELITLETLPNLTSIFKNSGLFNTRIHTLLDEYVGSSPSTSENDEDSVKGNNENNHEDEDDDMFNDGSECNDFLHQGGS